MSILSAAAGTIVEQVNARAPDKSVRKMKTEGRW